MIHSLAVLSDLAEGGTVELLHDVAPAHNALRPGTGGVGTTTALLITRLPLHLDLDIGCIGSRTEQVSDLLPRKLEDVCELPALELREKRPSYESKSAGGSFEMFGKPRVIFSPAAIR